jgi:hypothetical protein
LNPTNDGLLLTFAVLRVTFGGFDPTFADLQATNAGSS